MRYVTITEYRHGSYAPNVPSDSENKKKSRNRRIKLIPCRQVDPIQGV